VRHAETLAALKPGRARAGSFAPPPVKPNRGLTAPMAQLLAPGGLRRD
jgi:allantoin racemase